MTYFTITTTELLNPQLLRVDGGLWAQGAFVGERLIVEARDGSCVLATVEVREGDERPRLALSAAISSAVGLRVRRPHAPVRASLEVSA